MNMRNQLPSQNSETFAFTSLASLVKTAAKRFAQNIAFSRYQDGGFYALTYQELLDQAEQFSLFLAEQGTVCGDKIAILSESRPEWVVAALGVFFRGATLVPIDPGLEFDAMVQNLNHAEVKFLFASQLHFARADHLVDQVGSLQQKFSLEHWQRGSIAKLRMRHTPAIVATAEIAVIAYTSGTSGTPKGVMLSEAGLLTQAEFLGGMFLPKSPGQPSEVIFTILPLNHLYGFACNILGTIASGAQLIFAHSLVSEDISMVLQTKQPTMITGVPQFAQLIADGIKRQIKAKPPLTRALISFLMTVSKCLPRLAMRRRLFGTLWAKFGGRLRNITVGGAPLPSGISNFFETIGVPVYAGYGLTETSPIIAASFPSVYRKGSVGRPMPGIEVKVAKPFPSSQSGEILTRGPHVMKGYFKAPALDEDVFEDGWFKTGDIGYLDKDNYLFITGRTKNLIVLSSGKKVHPEELELVFTSSPLFEEVCVIGRALQTDHAGDQIISVVYPKAAMIAQYKDNKTLIEKAVMDEIHRLSRSLSSYKQPSIVIVRETPFAKTTSMKIKRAELIRELELTASISKLHHLRKA